jgi:hypothetical protein
MPATAGAGRLSTVAVSAALDHDGQAKGAIMRKSFILGGVLLSLVATLAEAGPPRRWGPGGPGYYRPPVVVGPAYPGWRAGYWGAGYWGPGYWGPGYWGPRVVVTTPGLVAPWPYAWGGAYAVPYAAPPVVVTTPAPAPAVPDTSYWYYCTQPAGYHPYVQECSQPWMKVVPQQPGETATPPRLAP